MSLQVWLPLNGNLNNQGLSDVTVTNIGMTYTNGKVTSQAGYFALSKTATINTKTLNSDFSVSVWVKPANNTTGLTGNILTNGVFYLRNGATWGNYLMFYVFTKKNDGTYDGVNHVVQLSLLPANTWTHICITKKDNIVKSYVNGNLTNTITKETSELKPITENLVICSGNTREQSVNDIRIYDECLSEKQIKELSKGLCLHYKLSRGGENLLTSSIGEFTGTNTSTSSIKDFKAWSNVVTPESDSWYTTSFDVKGNVNGSYFYQYLFNNSTGRQCDKSILYINGKLIGTYTSGDGNTSLIPLTTDYQHIVIIRHFNTHATALAKTLLFRIATGSNYTVTIKNVKLEEGDYATSWLPNKSDTLYSQLGYNNIEPDCSGYGNDGVAKGTITYSNDSPRYEGSSLINTGIFGSRKFPDSVESITLSAWVKASNITLQSILGNWESGGCGIETTSLKKAQLVYHNGSSYSVVTGTTTLSNDTWYLITGVFSYADKKAYIYVNGVLETSIDVSTYIRIGYATNVPMSIGNPSSTSVSGITNCYVSDARVYATALSADDIKALYNNPISIDDSGILHCMELEQTNNQTSFCKSGITKMEMLPTTAVITQKCAGNNYTKCLKQWANGSQLKLSDVHKIRIIFRSRGDGTPTSSKCSAIGCIAYETAWKWSKNPISWSSSVAYSNIGKVIDQTGSFTINSTMTGTTTTINVNLLWIIQNGWANGNDGQTHDLYYYKYWNSTTGEVYAEGGIPEYDRIQINDFIED